MLQHAMSFLLGIFFTFLVFGFCWVWFLGPIVRSIFKSCKLFVKSLNSTFKLGITIGNKVIKSDVEPVIEPDGEVHPGAVLLDAVATPSYEIAKWVKSQSIKKVGYVLYRGYSKHLERCLVVENSAIQKRIGKRIKLPIVSGVFLPDEIKSIYLTDDLARIMSSTIDEVQKMVDSGVSKIESPKVVAPKVVAIETEEPVIEAPVASPVMTEIPQVKKGKALESYKGYLISYGNAIRAMPGSSSNSGESEGNKEIEQFRLVIRSEDGIEESIWGQDLARAIKDDKIELKDKIEVKKTGKRQFGSSWKNLYEISKLA